MTAARLAAAAASSVAAAPPGPIGVAVSGGGDSVALLLLLHRHAGRPLAAVTIDHGLRSESAGEAAAVAALCARLGVPHAVRRWDGAGAGNLQMRAREAGVGIVALGHTLDDQAETFLLRLARGSGVDGLAAMAPVADFAGIVWIRPLLGARARVALEAATTELARSSLKAGAAGDVELAADALAGAPAELALRLLAGALCWVSGARYRPRLARLEAALAAVVAGRLGHGLTLHGCILRARRGRVAIRREPARVASPVPLSAGDWDGRWRLVARPEAAGADLTIGALGAEGLARLPDWRAAGVAGEALLTTPAVWRGAALVAAPLARAGSGYAFRRTSPLTPPWGAGDNALNPPVQSLC